MRAAPPWRRPGTNLCRPLRGVRRTPSSSYRHGHFGPALAGPLRTQLSPLQSNWRWYLRREGDPAATPVVLFDRNTMDQVAYVAGARACSDAMQPHLAARFVHVLQGDGGGSTRIDPGQGSAPALRVQWQPAQQWDDAQWQQAFGTRETLLRFLTCQDEAIARTCDGRWASTRIALPVDLATLQPLRLTGTLACPRLQDLGVRLEEGLAFRLPRVAFRVVSERLL